MIRLRTELVSEARRADSSLADLLSVGDVVRVTATSTNRRVSDAADVDEVVLAQPATLTVSSPPPPAADGTTTAGRGKLHVLTYRGGRVDSTSECVPCAYDYTAKRRRIDIRVWQLSGIGYVCHNIYKLYFASRAAPETIQNTRQQTKKLSKLNYTTVQETKKEKLTKKHNIS